MSLDTFRTEHLLKAAFRFTPAREMTGWTATKGCAWIRKGDEWQGIENGQVVDTASDADFREMLLEQLAEYEVTESRINFALS
jgi:hypothetical protein